MINQMHPLPRSPGTRKGAVNRKGWYQVVSIREKGVFMIDITKDIQSVTTFRRNPGEFMKQLKKNKRPVLLTVKGKPEAVLQDAASYQRLLDIVARADVHEAIRQGLDDVAHGRTRPAREVFDELRLRHGIPR